MRSIKIPANLGFNMQLQFYERTVRHPDGSKEKIYRDATPDEEARYNASRKKKKEYLDRYSNNQEQLRSDLEEALVKYRILMDQLRPIEVEINYLRYIDKTIRSNNGERVEWMGS